MTNPTVSIGLPVYNGEQFLEQALDTLLNQTFTNFELILSDNASTDATPSIASRYASADQRIRYVRHQRNLGAAGNFNEVFKLSRGTYFKWAAHDDLHEPGFLSACVECLESNPAAALAYTRAVSIDSIGQTIKKPWGDTSEFSSTEPAARFRAGLAKPHNPIPLPVFGLIRAELLRKTRVYATYAECDFALLAELALQGPFIEISEPLFLHREHASRAGHQLSKNPNKAIEFWKSTKAISYFPHWKLLSRHLTSILRSPVGAKQKLRCLKVLAAWLHRYKTRLTDDLANAAEQLPGVGNTIARYNSRRVQSTWTNNVLQAEAYVNAVLPEDAVLILVDNAEFGARWLHDRSKFAFTELDGKYNGPPSSNDMALTEFQRLRDRGAQFLVLGWPAFWWKDYYGEFFTHLTQTYNCIAENNQIQVFDIREYSTFR